MRLGDSPELRALQDTLSRQNAEMRHKYEAFMASDALAIMANGGGRERSDSRDITHERNARLGCKSSIISITAVSHLMCHCSRNTAFSRTSSHFRYGPPLAPKRAV